MNQKQPVIILTAGGSGGHITPLLAVAAELKRRQPEVRLVYIGQKGDRFADIPAKDPHIDVVYTIRAGKFRRYHGEGLKQLLDFPTILKNLRDIGYILIGTWQSWRLLRRLQPDVLFTRGGYVSVPVAFGAVLNHVPYITHDSDAIPSLANRLIAPWASLHAVALPKEVYTYPPEKTVTTGIPIQATFEPVTAALKQHYRRVIKVANDAKLLLVVGGGLGSQGLNMAVAEALPHLLDEYHELQVVHIVGEAHEATMQKLYETRFSAAEQSRVQIFGYLSDAYRYSGAADIIVTRGGATTLAEYAVQGKACIVIPSSFLTGGHQLKNAQYLQNRDAALVIREDELEADPNRLARQVSDLLKYPEQIAALEHKLTAFAKADATEKLATLIMEQAAARAA